MSESETMRKAMADLVNTNPHERADLEKMHGQVWDTQELQRDYTVLGFAAPFVAVERKADGVQGLLLFQHLLRFYFGFQAT